MPWTLLLAVLAGGTFVRLVGLGGPDFYNDELYIVYAAQALERQEGPVLPSGESYGRGLDITRLVGLSLRHVADAEAAARLPSALFGILGLILFAGIAWAMAGPWAAVWAALLLAIYPEAISQSRITRFYTYQMTFGLIAFYAGWRAVRTAGLPIPEEDRRRVVRAEWGWILVALMALGLAARVQPTALSIAAAWMACVGLGGLADLARRSPGAWRHSARVQAVVIGLVGLVLAAALRPSTFRHLIDLSQAVPQWAGGSPADARGYYWALAGTFPVIITLLPACILATAFRNVRLAAFLAIWFLVPFALHSFVLPWKAERYLLLAMPAFFMLAATAAVVGCGAIFERMRRMARQAGAGAALSRASAGLAVAVVAGFAIVATPAFTIARNIPPFIVDLHWRTAHALIQALPGSDSLVVGSSYPINALYYWERADFGVSTASLERPPLADDPVPRFGLWARYDDGVPDYYTAVPVITRPVAIRERFTHATAAVIAIDRGHLMYGHVDPALTEALAREAVELCNGSCGRLLLYYWPLDGAADLVDVPAAPARGAHSLIVAPRAW